MSHTQVKSFNFIPEEVTEERYFNALECMPPIYIGTIDGKLVGEGFAISEPVTSVGNNPTFTTYFQDNDNGKFYRCECWLNGVTFNNYNMREYRRNHAGNTVKPYESKY